MAGLGMAGLGMSSVLAVCAHNLVLSAAGIAAPTSAPEDVQDIVYLSAQGPVFIRLRMTIDNLTLDQAAANLASSLFVTLDEDGDGLISLRQAASAPGIDRSLSEGEVAEWDTEPHDAKMSSAEFTAFLQGELGKLFFMRAVQSQQIQSINLFDRLDIDKDHRLTKEEFQKSGETLANHDYDDDDTISTVELLPFRNPIAPRVTSLPETSSADMPFVTLTASTFDSAVQVLLDRYAAPHTDQKANSVSADELGIDTSCLTAFDTDGDARLDLAELTTLCKNNLPDADLSIQLPRVKNMRPQIKVVSQLKSSAMVVERVSYSRLSLSVHNTKFELRAIGTGSQAIDNRSFYRLKFRTADGDKNGYLEATEFPGLEVPDVTFSQTDRNHDGKLFREELLMFLDGHAMAAQSRIVMSVLANNQSLFEALDGNDDNRLSAREFANASDAVAPLDQNQDGLLHKAELDQNYRITFSMGEPQLFQRSMLNSRPAVPRPMTSSNTSGPNWFRRMDRNQDGDISWREFLGPRPAFDKLDDNHDGLIDADEAVK
jgi:Ca2+-binding EF-hand superfamily protein